MAGRITEDKQQNIENVLQKVAKALEGLEYGEVVIKVQGGKVVFVDRYERERVG
ncbi:MAG: YezD family protein [Alkaliphilus sp.]|nr:YezD family protein [Alkaliphilus sp.]